MIVDKPQLKVNHTYGAVTVLVEEKKGKGSIMAVHEDNLKGQREILQEHDQRLSVLESFSASEKKRLDYLEGRSMAHDLESVKKQKDLDYLVKYIGGIQSMIRWSGTTLFVLLAGFFVWYVQNLSH